MDDALAYLDANRDAFLELLFDFLRIPSVSAQTKHRDDAKHAADFVCSRLESVGFEWEQWNDGGLPLVYGTRLEGEDRPTLLLYGHYDVQPPEPLDLWETPPFEPTIVDDEIRARGCADDKGPTLAMLLAAECLVQAHGELPINLKVLIEGEEEVGGQVIEKFVRARKDDLAADALVIADVSGIAKGVPALCYGLRGLVALEITLTGPGRDLHSGYYGGTVQNPAAALARLVASLHDAEGRVAVEGFYDGILPVDEAEHARLARLPYDEKAYLKETGAPALFGEAGYTTLERKAARPTCEVNGLFSGYAGEGAKTIVPARAGCKLTCRLAPGQDPAAVRAALERHLAAHCPPGVEMAVEWGHHAPAVYTDPETEWAKRACAAMENAFGTPAGLFREGGSIPIVNVFEELLGVQPLLLGTYAPGERAHSPNERYFVEDFWAGIRTGIHLFGGA